MSELHHVRFFAMVLWIPESHGHELRLVDRGRLVVDIERKYVGPRVL